jgi:hypothetical protein
MIRISRRTVLRAGLAAAGWTLLTAHSPYRQWIAYRQAHLLLFTTRDDPGSDELGEQLAARLRETLPDSRAQVARAPHMERMASLIVSGQADTAVLTRQHAQNLIDGAPPFADYGPIALRALGTRADYVLVCRPAFRSTHAFLIAAALCTGDTALLRLPALDDSIPPHAGAIAAASGKPPDE